EVALATGRGENPLPHPRPSGIRVLPGESVGELHPSRPSAEIGLMLTMQPLQMRGERPSDSDRQHGAAVAAALASPDDDLVALEVDVLHAQPQTFEEAQPGSVEPCHHHPTATGQIKRDKTART